MTVVGVTDDREFPKVRWTLRYLVELLEEGSNSAGEQLARADSRLEWRLPAAQMGSDEAELPGAIGSLVSAAAVPQELWPPLPCRTRMVSAAMSTSRG
jgi:hypothetical protein